MITQTQKRSFWLFILKAALMCANALIFSCFWYNYYTNHLYLHFAGNGNLMVIGLFMVLNITLSRLYGGFALTTSRISELAYSHAVALTMTHFIMYIVTWLLVRTRLPNIWPMLLCLLACGILSSLWSFFATRLTNRLMPPKHTLILYDNQKAFQSALEIAQRYKTRFHVIGTIAASTSPTDVITELEHQRPEAVLLCGVNSSLRNDIIKYCIEHSIAAYIRPNIGDFLISHASVMHMNNLPVYLCQRACPSLLYSFLKRLFDIILSAVGLIIASPFMLAAALAIKAYDGGPVLFTQERMTINRKVFRIHKFRSMRIGADKDGQSIVTLQNDERITPIGKIIRLCRVDELPQLLDILIGNMTIVGPRPERLETIELYEKEMPEFALRLQVKAGLTGYAQVYGKANTSPYDKLQMDLLYISGQSITMDFRIIMSTFKILFTPESTEGFDKKDIKTTVRNTTHIVDEDDCKTDLLHESLA